MYVTAQNVGDSTFEFPDQSTVQPATQTTTTTTWTDTLGNSSTLDDLAATTAGAATDDSLSPMAVHFIVVGVLFATVVALGLVNAYLHFRSQRLARRRFVAPPVERVYSRTSRRRRSRRRTESEIDEEEHRTRMTVRMKPTKMFSNA